ncbi:MAG: head-tail connector protein [Defluviitaleaceae bacterium]|nr:head-tail connector protein [Defluviitaleaceae bacterium]
MVGNLKPKTKGTTDDLLAKVKNNLILTHDEDDSLLRGFIIAAIDYAGSVQNLDYSKDKIPPAAEQAVIMLSSHFYESRDGSTAGFFAGQSGAAKQVWDAVNRLLMVGKRWEM